MLTRSTYRFTVCSFKSRDADARIHRAALASLICAAFVAFLRFDLQWLPGDGKFWGLGSRSYVMPIIRWRWRVTPPSASWGRRQRCSSRSTPRTELKDIVHEPKAKGVALKADRTTGRYQHRRRQGLLEAILFDGGNSRRHAFGLKRSEGRRLQSTDARYVGGARIGEE